MGSKVTEYWPIRRLITEVPGQKDQIDIAGLIVYYTIYIMGGCIRGKKFNKSDLHWESSQS